MKLAVCHVAGVVWPLSLAAKHLNCPWVTTTAFFVSSLLALLVNVRLQPSWTEFTTLSVLCQMHPLGVCAPAFALHPAVAVLLSTASCTASSQSFTNLVSGSQLPHLPHHHRRLCNNSPVTLSSFSLDGPPPHGGRNRIALHF